MNTRILFGIGLAAAGLALATGCGPNYSPRAENGITFYCPGAGNLDFGDTGIREGLEASGYTGEVAAVSWTISFNPAIDQAVKVNARLGASRLARAIERYADTYPGRPINLVGLSAGTGVAIFACEDLRPGYEVDNVILLSGSLSYDYDISQALRRIKGQVYNFYSPRDAVLAGPMKIFGTIDGKLGTEGVGAVGFNPPAHRDRVTNIRWQPEFTRYGYYGGHTDVTNARFVQAVISKYVTHVTAVIPPKKAPATERALAVLGEHHRQF
jgi:pimeloyl-ACP methyl ester carboxylesterase